MGKGSPPSTKFIIGGSVDWRGKKVGKNLYSFTGLRVTKVRMIKDIG